jgi:hypothetical protein
MPASKTTHELQFSVRNRKTRIKENEKLIEQHRFAITKIQLTIQHENEQLKIEEGLLKANSKEKRSLL